VVALDRAPAHPEILPATGEGEVCYRLDIRSTDSLERILRRERPTHCIQLATPSSVPQSFRNPVEDLEGHLLPTFSLFDAIRRSGLDVAVLLVSSAAVYGSPHRLPIREDHPLAPVSPYGHHTRMQEMVGLEHHELFGTRVCIARIFSTYGPGLRRLAVWEIARRAMGGDRTVLGTGRESRDYLHACDVAAALAKICDGARFAGEIVNVGSGEETPIRNLAREIYDVLSITEPFRFEGRPEPGKPGRWLADIGQLRRLGFSARIPLALGVRETVRWVARQ
jgi:UDP-glucose 4-epimerase